MCFVHLRDLSFIWPFREANTRSSKLTAIPVLVDHTSFTPFGKINEKQIESNNNYDN